VTENTVRIPDTKRAGYRPYRMTETLIATLAVL